LRSQDTPRIVSAQEHSTSDHTSDRIFFSVISTVVRSINGSDDTGPEVLQFSRRRAASATRSTSNVHRRRPDRFTSEKAGTKASELLKSVRILATSISLTSLVFQSLGVGCQSANYGIDSCLLRIGTSRTMSVHNVLPWRPKSTETVASEPELLWTMHKREWQIDCTLQNQGRNGWSVRVLLNGLGFHARRFRTWADAIEGAEDKYAELVRTGWTPVPLGTDDHKPL
jgi:hypothetical protein